MQLLLLYPPLPPRSPSRRLRPSEPSTSGRTPGRRRAAPRTRPAPRSPRRTCRSRPGRSRRACSTCRTLPAARLLLRHLRRRRSRQRALVPSAGTRRLTPPPRCRSPRRRDPTAPARASRSRRARSRHTGAARAAPSRNRRAHSTGCAGERPGVQNQPDGGSPSSMS